MTNVPKAGEQSSGVSAISAGRRRSSVERMPSYLVETYLTRGDAGVIAALEERARSAAEELTREGTSVGFGGSIHVPEDELCFFAFDAPSREVAALAAQLAGLDALRVVEAVSSREEHV